MTKFEIQARNAAVVVEARREALARPRFDMSFRRQLAQGIRRHRSIQRGTA